jgi:hypothetical protein
MECRYCTMVTSVCLLLDVDGSSGRYRHQSGDSDDLSDGGTRLSPASKGAALRSDKSSTVKFNLNGRF